MERDANAISPSWVGDGEVPISNIGPKALIEGVGAGPFSEMTPVLGESCFDCCYRDAWLSMTASFLGLGGRVQSQERGGRAVLGPGGFSQQLYEPQQHLGTAVLWRGDTQTRCYWLDLPWVWGGRAVL